MTSTLFELLVGKGKYNVYDAIKKLFNSGYDILCRKGLAWSLIKYSCYKSFEIITLISGKVDTKKIYPCPGFTKYITGLYIEKNESINKYYKDIIKKASRKKTKYDGEWSVEPRSYQIDALNAINKVGRAILWLACGMGKTLISIMWASQFNLIINISPLISSASQNLERLKKELPDYKSVFVSSDKSGTRSKEEIKSYFKNKKLIISCTYDSIDIIHNLIDDINNAYRSVCVIVDEFHHLSRKIVFSNEKGRNDYEKKFHEVLLQAEWKFLFMSATPRTYKFSTKKILSDDGTDYDIIDINDKKNNIENEENENNYCDILGKIVYSYGLREAINNLFVADYSLYIPEVFIKIGESIVSDEVKKELIGIYKKTGINEFDEDLLNDAKALFLLRGMINNGHNKCISFLSNKKHCDKFSDSLKRINESFELNLRVFIVIQIFYNQKEMIYMETLQCIKDMR